MKKLLGLLALTASVSNLALAETSGQDTLKKIYFSTEFRHTATDQSRAKSNELGLAGFRKANTVAVKWRNIVGGDLNLSDEGNLGLRFNFQNDQETEKKYNPVDHKNEKSNQTQTWENDIALYKDITMGSLDTRWDLGWLYKSTHGVKNYKYKGHLGTSNEIYFGPTFAFKIFGQPINTKTQLVYFDQSGNKNADNAWEGKDFARGKVSGWGFNLDLANDGTIFENRAGNLGYYVELKHHFRDAKGKLATGKEAGSSVYLDYVTGATYNTPSFAGLYGLINAENEWEKHTAVHGYKNTFGVWTGFGYKKDFDLPVGTLNVNPLLKYKIVDKETEVKYDASKKSFKKTKEINELRVGLNVALDLK